MIVNSVITAITTIYFWILASVSSVVSFIVCMVLFPFLTPRLFNKTFENIISTMILYGMTIPRFWSFTMIGPNKYDRSYIFVPNHVSFIDTLLAARIPAVKKFIWKSIYSHVPFFGWACLAAGHVPVNSTNKGEIVSKCIKGMEDGSSFLIFAEGTRSKSLKELLPFKTGAFRLAKETKTPIVPVAILGTEKAMPIGGICYPADLTMIIGDPIHIDDIETGIELTRKFILDQIKNYQGSNLQT